MIFDFWYFLYYMVWHQKWKTPIFQILGISYLWCGTKNGNPQYFGFWVFPIYGVAPKMENSNILDFGYFLFIVWHQKWKTPIF